jgi:hypothetical protein
MISLIERRKKEKKRKKRKERKEKKDAKFIEKYQEARFVLETQHLLT